MSPLSNISNDQLIVAYRNAVRSRTLDIKIMNSQRQGIIGFHVPSAGQEIIQVALGMLARKEDIIFGYYRDLALLIQRGIPLEKIIDQLLGNKEDLQKGRQMPDHFSFKDYNFSSIQSPVGAHLPLAVGAAYMLKYKGKEGIVIANFGDGATSTSDFHAAMNFAGVFNLKILFLCENNGWAISLPTEKQTKGEIYRKGEAYGIMGKRVDGNDLLSSINGISEAMNYIREGKGPYILEAVTYRIGPHSTSDDTKKYRVDEITDGSEKDPIRRLENPLLSMGILDEGKIIQIKEEAKREIDKIVEDRRKIGFPDKSTMFDDLYAETLWIQDEERRDVL